MFRESGPRNRTCCGLQESAQTSRGVQGTPTSEGGQGKRNTLNNTHLLLRAAPAGQIKKPQMYQTGSPDTMGCPGVPGTAERLRHLANLVKVIIAGFVKGFSRTIVIWNFHSFPEHIPRRTPSSATSLTLTRPAGSPAAMRSRTWDRS